MAAGYVDLDDMKAYLTLPEDGEEDVLIAELIETAKNHIDAWCGRHFDQVTQTRYYRYEDTHALSMNETRYDVTLYTVPVLFLDDDIISITTLTNGNGAVISSSDYRLLPRNTSPKDRIELINGVNWSFSTVYSEISVAGTWGYSSEVPEAIRLANRLLAAKWFYHRNASWVDEFGGVPDNTDRRHVAQTQGARAMPLEIIDILSPFKRVSR